MQINFTMHFESLLPKHPEYGWVKTKENNQLIKKSYPPMSKQDMDLIVLLARK